MSSAATHIRDADLPGSLHRGLIPVPDGTIIEVRSDPEGLFGSGKFSPEIFDFYLTR